MIISMTGFGAAEAITKDYSLKAEIRTLNSKFFDPQLKYPKEFASWETGIKSTLEKTLKRGKVSLVLDFKPQSDEGIPVEIDEVLLKSYYKTFDRMSHELGASADELFKLALHAPNVIMPKEDVSDVITWEEVRGLVSQAAENCHKFRVDEGQRLSKALSQSINDISTNLEEVKKLDPSRVENIKSRIKKSIEDIKDQIKVDENRFEQELIYYIEKLDITEEKVRLNSHLDYFREVMGGDESNGKKLSFISQEIGREINTIGSKANDAAIQRSVVNMKESLEMIKEQLLNVL